MGKVVWWGMVLALGLLLSRVDLILWWRRGVYALNYKNMSIRDGFLQAQKGFNPEDLDVDLTGKSFMITGANSGIGKAAATAIAQRNGTVHMICRSLKRGEAVKDEIIAETGNGNIIVHELDLSTVGHVHKFTLEFLLAYDKLDVLINNAGLVTDELVLTTERLETSFAVNTMGYFTLTTDLLPLLKGSSDPRVVMTSSGVILFTDLVIQDLQHENRTFDGLTAYAQQKRHQIVLAEKFAKLHPTVFFATLDPGWVVTPMLKSFLSANRYEVAIDGFRTADQGADTIIWLAISEAATKHDSGLYFMDRKPAATSLPYTFINEDERDKKKLMIKLKDISDKTRPDFLPPDYFEDNS